MSKRKATYSRADRGKYTSRKRKEAARKVIECRWKGIDDPSEHLGGCYQHYLTNGVTNHGFRQFGLWFERNH